MDNEDGFEQSARIVEAFVPGQPDDIAELLTRIAAAIRDRAVDN
ncbi:hypothetical protein [Sphingopyxis sp. R3-92]